VSPVAGGLGHETFDVLGKYLAFGDLFESRPLRAVLWVAQENIGPRVLLRGPRKPYNSLVDDMTLPPDLARFAEEAVAAGRFPDVAAVVAAGVGLLQRREQARAELLASVLASKDEAERDGCLAGDEVAERVRATIARKTNATA
jgi:putative addiction module CopG family antidote